MANSGGKNWNKSLHFISERKKQIIRQPKNEFPWEGWYLTWIKRWGSREISYMQYAYQRWQPNQFRLSFWWQQVLKSCDYQIKLSMKTCVRERQNSLRPFTQNYVTSVPLSSRQWSHLWLTYITDNICMGKKRIINPYSNYNIVWTFWRPHSCVLQFLYAKNLTRLFHFILACRSTSSSTGRLH